MRRIIEKFKITCDEATTICDKSQYNQATFFELVKLNLHFLGCKICKMYSKQNGLMSRILKKNNVGKSICQLTDEEKEAMRLRLEEEKTK